MIPPSADQRSPNVEAGDPAPLNMSRIQEYVWARYVNHDPPPQAIDEDQALAVLESYYATHPMASDAECFYYGILAFERSFASPERRRDLLKRALEAFRAYRQQTSPDFTWEVVDDRYQETLDGLGLTDEAAP